MSGLQNLIKFGLLKKNTADQENFPVMQITYLKKVADAVVLNPYGLNIKGLPDKTLCVVFNIQGNEENRIAIPLATTNRKKGLKDGEIVLYNEQTKDFLYLKQGNTAELKVLNQVLISTLSTVLTGNLLVQGTGQILGAFGCNTKLPQLPFVLNPAATNLAEVIALTNQIRQALINNGIGV